MPYAFAITMATIIESLGRLARLVDPVDQLVFPVRLPEHDLQAEVGADAPALGLDVGERLAAVDLRLALADSESGRLLHSFDDALRFFVFPAGDETGAVLLEGTWTMQEIGPAAQIRRP